MPMTKREHVAWARDRAYVYIDMEQLPAAYSSFASDMMKHDEALDALRLFLPIGQHAVMSNNVEDFRRWIDGF